MVTTISAFKSVSDRQPTKVIKTTSMTETILHPLVSVFNHGYTNRYNKAVMMVRPIKDTTIEGIYKYIVGHWAKDATERLREIEDHKKAQEFKKLNFMFFTPNGTFSYRRAQDIKERSQLMVFDIDGLTSTDDVQRVKQTLLADEQFDTILLFVSPSGHGLKWIIFVGDMDGLSHKQYFHAVSNYLETKHSIKVDQSGSDICRACYLPHDPECFIKQNDNEHKI